MSVCKICGKQLKTSGESVYFSKHVRSWRCLKITNDLWYQRDLLLQKIENGDASIDTLQEYETLDKKHEMLMDYRRYRWAKGSGRTGIPDSWIRDI